MLIVFRCRRMISPCFLHFRLRQPPPPIADDMIRVLRRRAAAAMRGKRAEQAMFLIDIIHIIYDDFSSFISRLRTSPPTT